MPQRTGPDVFFSFPGKKGSVSIVKNERRRLEDENNGGISRPFDLLVNEK